MTERALPRLTQASLPLSQSIDATDQHGQRLAVHVPVERALTIYVNRAEIVTLMTLGAHPEWLVLGYLLSQRLVGSAHEVESITVDWDTSAAAVRTVSSGQDTLPRNASRVVTTGCGQGSMFSDLIDALDPVSTHFPVVSHDTVAAIANAMRQHDTLYKKAGSVHACALFDGAALRCFIEDVGRHNALDSIAGWRALQPIGPAATPTCPILYTTGRLTSEMIIESAQMQIPVVISRSGTTAMAIEVAERHGVCAIGRALNQRFLCYTHPSRIRFTTATAPSAAPTTSPA